jgi:outer membrane murein-binding lipoprotein Lpp
MIKTVLTALVVASTLVAGAVSVSAAPKCKAGSVYSEDAGKCVPKAPRGS